MEPGPAQRAARDRIAAGLATTGYALPGTLTVRACPCGKTGCRCHADPPRLHGPYAEWTRETGGKTVTRRLTPAGLAGYQPPSGNAKKLRVLLAELQDPTLEDHRGRQRPGTVNHRTGRTPSGKCELSPLNLWAPPQPELVSPAQPQT